MNKNKEEYLSARILIALIVFAFFSISSFFHLITTIQILPKAVDTVGHVERSDISLRSYYPLVNFNDLSGKNIEFKGEIGWSHVRSYTDNQPITIMYDPANYPCTDKVFLSIVGT